MKFRVGLAQIGPTLGNLEANWEILEKEVKSARRKGVDLLIFPELSLTGYFLKDMVPEVALRRDAAMIKEIARLSRDVALIVGFIEESGRHAFYNVAGYFENGKLLHVHRKIYLPTYGLFDEARYVGAGQGLRAFDTQFGRAAILVCEDAWHPSLAYIASQDGADLLFIPSSSPSRGVQRKKGKSSFAIERTWQSLNRCYAGLFNQFVFFSNRVGYEDGINFWGGSEIILPNGEPLAAAPRGKARLLIGEVDTADIRRTRIASPTLKDENVHLALRELRRIQGKEKG
ncbi:MAG: carbon-nitrogen hydrolase [bacterium]|nr:carbon-nitrogen hydrolase [bacterium]